jgi:hypothetical protein
MAGDLALAPAPITRPDGTIYRPRKVVAEMLHDDDELPVAVLVLGTHDTERALELAREVTRIYLDPGYEPVRPELGWWETRMSYGRRSWEHATKGGRAGVYFPEIVEGGTDA